jgi:ubiquinone/menaquinone biosynthesis C-methylase UbiE
MVWEDVDTMKMLYEKTSIKYRGQFALNYERKRRKQIRWKLENEIVTGMLQGLRGTVLDCPVGTGRFLALYQALKLECTGIDSSEQMLALAMKKKLPCTLQLGDATRPLFKDKTFDHAVCVRFLDLIDEVAMQRAVQELCAVTRHTIICTIRFGERYILKVNTATHDEAKFKALLKKCGWNIVESQPIFKQGWFVLKLKPREKTNVKSSIQRPPV